MVKSVDKKDSLAYRLFFSVWRRKFVILLLVVVVVAAVSYRSVTDALSQASSYIKLDFESAHDGHTPNGTRFNIYDIKSRDLLNRALTLTGLSDQMTWIDLAECMTVAPSRSQSVSKRYIATEYTATLIKSPAFGHISARSMLDVICRLYYQDFLRQSGVNHAQLSVDWNVVSDLEYLEISDYIKTRTDILRQFLLNRIEESAGYDSEDPALSFRALKATVDTFQSVYIDKFTSLISQSRLFKDAEDYKTKLTYQRMLINQDYQLSRSQYAIREEALGTYEESLIAIVMVPTYYQSNGLYMSRTQIGIDTLTKEAEKYSLVSQEQARNLAKIGATIDALSAARLVDSDRAETLLADICRQYDDLAGKIIAADEAYMAYTARNFVSFEARTPGLTDAYGVKDALVYAALCAALLGGAFFLIDEKRRRDSFGGGRGES